ncbi:MnhB domain-containing protein [Thermohalobacter berrensis]|uniref:MnhB domain-containing protein n=1 Tax=Thermohalobacter berrensis TaxID=99594 RepID=UPI0015FFA5F4|nr:MnhB domain-containing protein [Thermohalobacter berrensis]
MRISLILVCISRLLYPFILLFGFYIILNGDKSPGGGFQGGVILATAFFITYFIDPKKIINLKLLVKIEKYLFALILIVACISYFTNGEFFTNFIPVDSPIENKRIFLILLNFFIGLKVTTGLIAVFSAFIEEGR